MLPEAHFRLDGQSVFDVCTPHSNDKALIARLQRSSPSVAKSEELLRTAWANGDPTEYLRRARFPMPCEDAALRDLYSRVLRDGAQYPLYDEMRGRLRRGCCQCRNGVAYTLDHYFPQSTSPELSVVPINLIPTCRDCNSNKHTLNPKTIEDCVFNPFFDDWRPYRLVAATLTVEPAVGVVVEYHVTKPIGCPDLVYRRAVKTFAAFKLDVNFSVAAGRHLTAVKGLCRLAGGAGAVRQLLEHQATSLSDHNPNGWDSVMYRTLAACDAFVEGGWQAIP